MLDGLRVVELAGSDVWGAAAVGHCGRILADLGADVVKVEPPSGDPVRTTLPQSPFWTGMYGAMGALLAVVGRRRHGDIPEDRVFQHVDVSGQQSMVTVHPPAPVFADVAHEEHMRLGPNLLGRSIVGARFRNVWPCADGHVAFAIQGGPIGRHTGRQMTAWMAGRAFAAP